MKGNETKLRVWKIKLRNNKELRILIQEIIKKSLILLSIQKCYCQSSIQVNSIHAN